MQTVPLQLTDVVYNASNQSFEALVTVHDIVGISRYACAIQSPIDTEFEIAAAGLAKQALRRHVRGQRDSVQIPARVASRAGRPTPTRETAIGTEYHAHPQAA